MADLVDSPYDLIIKGDKRGYTVLHEDDKVIVFEEKDKVAKTHLIVLAKTTSVQALSLVDPDSEEHKALLGHMMVIAAKIGREQKLEEGYRIVNNTGPSSGQTIPNLFL